MNMYYYSYSDDEYENEFVEVVMVYYDNDDDFVLSINEYDISSGVELWKKRCRGKTRGYTIVVDNVRVMSSWIQ